MQSSSSNLIQPLKLCTHNWNTSTPKTITISRQCCRISRRELSICTNSSLLLLFGSQALDPLLGISTARADEETLEKLTQIQAEEESQISDGNHMSLNQTTSEENRTETENPTSLNEIEQEVTKTGTEIPDNINEVERKETTMTTEITDNLTEVEQKETTMATEIPDNLTEVEQKETTTVIENVDNLDQIVQKETTTGPEIPDNQDQIEQKETRKETENVASQSPSKRVFLEVAIDREPIGKIVIELNNETVPVGTSRFINLVSGKAGISYRRKEFLKITPNYVQHGGVRSYGVDAELASKTGTSLAIDRLVDEWDKQNGTISGTKNVAGSVSLIVRDPSKPPPKMKLVARKGKLEIDQEEVGKDPNGTEFVISVRDSPELDESAVVIGRVVEGMEVAERIAQVKTVKENTTSPYFRVAKLIGDKRAVVAERGFNRPYSKVQILNCGLIN